MDRTGRQIISRTVHGDGTKGTPVTIRTSWNRGGQPYSTREMFDRYNTIDDQDSKSAIERLRSFLEVVDQTVDQDEKRNQPKMPDSLKVFDFLPYAEGGI